MLPMFDQKKIVSVLASRRGKPSVEVANEVEAPGSEMDSGLKEAAVDILRAIESKSPMDLARALKAAYEVCESYEDEPMPEMEEGE